MIHSHHTPAETQEISLRIEHYDDIFSDFDIRPYSKRALSTDFLNEVRRASADKKKGEIDLAFYVAEKDRNESHESVIRERLVEHFKKHYRMIAKEKRGVLRLGLVMMVFGVIFMIGATRILYEDPTHSMLLSFLVVFLEPAAWFLLWEGADQVLYHARTLNPELRFYQKMSSSDGHIHFKSF